MSINTALKEINIINKRKPKNAIKKIKANYELYIFLIPAIVYILIFHYAPMYGVQIAFKDFIASKGIIGSPWIGFTHFERFFKSYQFWRIIKNTFSLSIYQLLAGFPTPIILALLLNSLTSTRYKKLIQTATYAPYFISTVVLVSMLLIFLSPRSGLVNNIIVLFGGTPVHFIAKSEWFKPLYIISGVWQTSGWNAIIYIAALSSVGTELHEAAKVDGATKFKRIIHIDLPGIMPTAVILLILNLGNIMSVGFEKAYLMQNSLNITTSEIISTYVYKIGLVGADYSYSATVGLFNSLINFSLLIAANKLAKKFTEVSLW